MGKIGNRKERRLFEVEEGESLKKETKQRKRVREGERRSLEEKFYGSLR